MNTKHNKRRQSTLLLIESVFMELIKQQELSKIRVSTICEKAGINRGTFYANYADVYALADTIRYKLQQEVNGLFAQLFVEGATEAAFLTLLQHIQDNQDRYSFYFKSGFDVTYEFPYGDVRAFFQFGKTEHLAYHIAFFKSGFNAIVNLWLSGGCRETPEEIRNILLLEYRGRLPLENGVIS